MGRGLSKLQRWILGEAGKRRRVYYADIMEGFFGFRPRRRIRRYEEGHVIGGILGFKEEVITGNRVGEIAHPGGQKFSRKEIGEHRYQSAVASISRSCRRLEERGLVTCLAGAYSKWSAVEITEQGRNILSVNNPANVPPS